MGRKAGLTLVELLIATVIGVILLGLAYLLSSNLTAGFRKGEETSKAMQQARLFVGTLRRDLANAVKALEPGQEDWRLACVADERSFRLRVFNSEGTIDTVRYLFEPGVPGTSGGSLVREVEGKGRRPLIEGLVSSLAWAVNHEEKPVGAGLTCKRLWLDLSLVVGGLGRTREDASPVPITAKLFPVRLNRALNWRNPRGEL